jgi:hypothetical protein
MSLLEHVTHYRYRYVIATAAGSALVRARAARRSSKTFFDPPFSPA